MTQPNSLLAIAQKLQTQLSSLLPPEAVPELSQRLYILMAQAKHDPQDETLYNQLLYLFIDFPQVGEWLHSQQGETTRSAKGPVPGYRGVTRGLQRLPGEGVPTPTHGKYRCPVCNSKWTRMYRGEPVEDCNCQVEKGGELIKRIPVGD